jgi:hypothetical protein
VDLKEKVTQAFRGSLDFDQIRLEDEDGIYGYVVSEQFYDMPDLDRQKLIGKALRNGPAKLTKAERRRILMIAALTPAEYAAVGPLPFELTAAEKKSKNRKATAE